jgi:shikimate kinase
MERLKSLGTVVWLAADFEVLYERACRGSDRPMLAGRSREDVRALYEARKADYGQAHLAVEVSRLGVDGTVSRILRYLQQRLRAMAAPTP